MVRRLAPHRAIPPAVALVDYATSEFRNDESTLGPSKRPRPRAIPFQAASLKKPSKGIMTEHNCGSWNEAAPSASPRRPDPGTSHRGISGRDLDLEGDYQTLGAIPSLGTTSTAYNDFERLLLPQSVHSCGIYIELHARPRSIQIHPRLSVCERRGCLTAKVSR
jgi:hypothetical protein